MNALQISHEEPMSSSAALARLRSYPEGSLVVARDPDCERPEQPQHTLFFAENKGRLKPVLDAWLAPGAREEVVSALGATMSVFTGSCSSLYVRGASVVWADDGGELRLWRCGRLVGRFRAGETLLRCCLIGPWRRFANSHFSCAHGFLSSSWLWRGVRLQAHNRSVRIVHSLDPIVLFDPTYHGPELTRDAGWVRELARAISRITAIPVKLDAPLA